MSYRIYADRVWIMHTCINVLLLFLTAKLSGITVRVRRIIEIAAGNALCFTAILLLPAPAVLQGEVGIILAGKTFFCLIAALWWVQRCFQVKSREGMRRVWICYMCCACVLGGVCNGISEVRELFETDQNGFGTGGQVSMMQLLVWCAIVVWYGAKLLERERMRQKHPIWKVSFFWKTKFFSGSALMDSGNSLKDPYTGRPGLYFGRRNGEKAWNFDGKGGSADSLSQHRQEPRTPSGGDGFRTVSEKRRTGEKDCRCDGCGRTRAFEPVGRIPDDSASSITGGKERSRP